MQRACYGWSRAGRRQGLMNELSDAGRRRFATGAAKRRVWLGARRRGNAAPTGDNARRRDSPMHGAGACGRGAGASEEGLDAAPPALENASLALFGAASGPEPFQTSRFAQDSRRRQTLWLPSRVRTRKSAVSKGEDRCPEQSQAFTSTTITASTCKHSQARSYKHTKHFQSSA